MKRVDFSETIAACDLKAGRADNWLSLWRYVSIEGQGRQGHFLTLAKGHLHMKIKTCFSQKSLGYI